MRSSLITLQIASDIIWILLFLRWIQGPKYHQTSTTHKISRVLEAARGFSQGMGNIIRLFKEWRLICEQHNLTYCYNIPQSKVLACELRKKKTPWQCLQGRRKVVIGKRQHRNYFYNFYNEKRQLQQPSLPMSFPPLIILTIGTKGILVFSIFIINSTI